MRGWSISIWLVGPEGEEVLADCFEKATYLLHESFGKRAKQSTSPGKSLWKERYKGEVTRN